MPIIARFEGVAIYMYFKDHNPPHVHAFHGDDELLVAVADGAVLAGSLPGRQLAATLAWVRDNAAELGARWEEMR